MKIGVFLIIILAGLAVSCKSKQHLAVPKGEYLIQGQLKNVPDGSLIQLFEGNRKILSCVCVDTLINGYFTFRDTVTVPRKVFIRSREKGFPGTSLDIWVASGKKIEISGEDKLLRTWRIKSDIPEQQEENLYNARKMPEEKEWVKHSVAVNSWMMLRTQANSGDVREKVRAKTDSIFDLMRPLKKIMDKKEMDYMKTAPVSKIWMDKLLDHAESMESRDSVYQAQVRELYARLTDDERRTDLGRGITSYIFPVAPLKIGDEVSDDSLLDRDGKKHRISELKGKYVLLDFWSCGCIPCRLAVPEIEEVAAMYKEKLVVVGICEDPVKMWKEFLDENKMSGMQWNGAGREGMGIAERYQAKGLPHYVLVAPDGKIQDIWGGYQKGVFRKRIEQTINP